MVILNTIIAIFFLLSSIILLFSRWRSSERSNGDRRSNLPPGPPSLPLIGHIHLLLGTLPFRAFDTLAKTYGEIMHLKLGQVPVVVISSPEMAKEVLKTHDPVFAARPESVAAKIIWYDYKNIVFGEYGDYWRQMRKICIVELLSAKNVRSIGSIRSDEISNLVKSIGSSSGSVIDLTDMVLKCMSSITCRAAYGKICKDKDALTNVMSGALRFAGGFTLADLFPSWKVLSILSWNKYKLLRMRRWNDVILDGIIDEHKLNLARGQPEEGDSDTRSRAGCNGEFGNEDLVDVLLRVQESGELQFPITNDHIKAVIFDIFAGATESTSATVDWAMVEFMRNPHVMAKAQAEVRRAFKDESGQFEENEAMNKLKYLKLVIKEVLRLHPAGAFVPRASRQDSEINGYYIPAKTRVLVNTWAMGRNPDYFPDPESFRPERFEDNGIDFNGGNFEYLPFGAGKRMCPGMTFGLTGIELPLAQLLYHFDWQLPQGIKASDLDMIENFGLSSPRKNHLQIVATPYNVSS